MSYRHLRQKDRVYWLFFGTISDSDLLSATDTFYAMSDLQSINFSIVDFSEVESINLSNAVIKSVARRDILLSQNCPHIKFVLVGGNPLGYGLMRMYELRSTESAWEVLVFADKVESEKWLDSQ